MLLFRAIKTFQRQPRRCFRILKILDSLNEVKKKNSTKTTFLKKN